MEVLNDLPREGKCLFRGCDEQHQIKENNAGNPSLHCPTYNAVVNIRDGFDTLADVAFDAEAEDQTEVQDDPDDDQEESEEMSFEDILNDND